MKRFASWAAKEIESLDLAADHQRIVFLSCQGDFARDTPRALDYAVFRTIAFPAFRTALHPVNPADAPVPGDAGPAQRAVSELMEHGYDSKPGKDALERLWAVQGGSPLSQEDFLYFLSAFVFEPIRWNARFGWRCMTEKERLALFEFWRHVGWQFKFYGIPPLYTAFERYNLEYERVNGRLTEEKKLVEVAARRLFRSWFPRWMHPLVNGGAYGFMDDRFRRAFGFPRPSPMVRRSVASIMRIRGFLLRFRPGRGRRSSSAGRQSDPAGAAEM